MTDLTPTFGEQIKKHGGTLAPSYDIRKINTFLQESHSIHARIADLIRTLRQTRARYLSTGPSRTSRRGSSQPLSERERDTFDAQSKQLMRQLSNAIKGLKQAQDLQVQTNGSVALAKRSKGGLGALGRWAAGGAVTAKSVSEELDEARRNTIAAFREAVIMFLQANLERASTLQAEMMEARLSREMEKSRSMLARSHAGQIAYAADTRGSSTTALSQEQVTGGDQPSELTSEQMELFAAENSEMLKHYEDQLDQVRKAERSILEISELHSQLHASLDQQSHHIDQLVEESYITSENLDKGNKELKRASERKSTAQAVFFATLGFCSFLVVWDLVF